MGGDCKVIADVDDYYAYYDDLSDAESSDGLEAGEALNES